MYQVIFAVRCDTCGQTLEPTVTDEGVAYTHGNVEDCTELGVTLPAVTTDDLIAAVSVKKTPKPKAPTKKKAK